MNPKAVTNKIEELRIKYKISDKRWREMLTYIPDDLQGDNNHVLLLLNIYAMFMEMGLGMNEQRAKMTQYLGWRVMTIWKLSNANAKILQRSLIPEYQLHLREQREPALKTPAHKYELLFVVSGECVGFDDLKTAVNQGYFYDGMDSNVKVLSVDGVVYRIFLNGTMFEPVDLREWR